MNLLAATLGVAHAISFKPHAVDSVLENSDAVIEGEVVQITYTQAPGLPPMTWAIIEVDTVLHGTVLGARVAVGTPGGPTEDGDWMYLAGVPHYELGDYVIAPIKSHEEWHGPGRAHTLHSGPFALKRDSHSAEAPITVDAWSNPVSGLQSSSPPSVVAPIDVPVLAASCDTADSTQEQSPSDPVLLWSEARDVVTRIVATLPEVHGPDRTIHALPEAP